MTLDSIVTSLLRNRNWRTNSYSFVENQWNPELQSTYQYINSAFKNGLKWYLYHTLGLGGECKHLVSVGQLTWHRGSWRLRTATPQAGAVIVVRYVASLLWRARLLPAIRLVLARRRTTRPGPRLVRRQVVRGLSRPHPLRCPAIQSPADPSRVTSHHHVSANHSPVSKPSSILSHGKLKSIGSNTTIYLTDQTVDTHKETFIS